LQLQSDIQLVEQLLLVSCIRDNWRWKNDCPHIWLICAVHQQEPALNFHATLQPPKLCQTDKVSDNWKYQKGQGYVKTHSVVC
jgi:hypothetical protein